MNYKAIIKIALGILAGFTLGCSKEENPVVPILQEEVNFRFEFPVFGVGDISNNGILFARMEIRDSVGTTVWNDKEIDLEKVNGIFQSESLKLKNGLYSLHKLIIYSEDGFARYAVPLKDSPEGQNNDFGLPITFKLNPGMLNIINQPVTRVLENSRPEEYGYEDPVFGENRLIAIRIRTDINVGNFVYEGLPSLVHVTAINETGQKWNMDISLERGTNIFNLPANYSIYHFEWFKWDLTGELIVSEDTLEENMLIIMNGSKPAKLIQYEESFLEVENTYYPQSKTEYFYDGAGKLIRRDNYQKTPQFPDLILQTVTDYLYNPDGTLDKLVAKYTNQEIPLETRYTWANGNLQKIEPDAAGMIAEIRHDQVETDLIQIIYHFNNGQYFHYGFRFEHGNKIQEFPYSGSNTNSSYGQFEYDEFINPYYLWGITDEYLRYSSKNNEIKAEYTYGGGFPVFIPDTYNYTYDFEGYPVQLVRTFKTYQTQQFGYREKIIYHY